jgi:hypothetical protein
VPCPALSSSICIFASPLRHMPELYNARDGESDRRPLESKRPRRARP